MLRLFDAATPVLDATNNGVRLLVGVGPVSATDLNKRGCAQRAVGRVPEAVVAGKQLRRVPEPCPSTACGRQRLQGRALEIEPLAIASIAAPDDLVDKAAIGL